MLIVKVGKNFILDLTASRYNEALCAMIECLRFLPLAQALTIAESIPPVYLSKAYLSATYVLADDVINFVVDSQKTSITKSRFCRILWFDTTERLVDLDSISFIDLIHMFYQMGYLGETTLLSKFKKPNLPTMWNGLFMLLFKSLSERVSCSDSASKLFYTIRYGLYHGINLDYGYILWTQLILSTPSSTRNTKITCA